MNAASKMTVHTASFGETRSPQELKGTWKEAVHLAQERGMNANGGLVEGKEVLAACGETAGRLR